ncbi:MAG: thioredoxin family protein [Planctomycetes bacterium]|nr:thioredoxin family protein [Planctomycetota bacterium]
MPTKTNPKQTGLLPKILILAGIVVLVVVMYLVKNQPSKSILPADKAPESQFDRYLKEGRPTLAFFHSTNCHSCIVMMDTVALVYPEFKDGVALVDVDVYNSQNENLLRRVGINYIPTLVFIDRKGQVKVSIGVMEAYQLRTQLRILQETP